MDERDNRLLDQFHLVISPLCHAHESPDVNGITAGLKRRQVGAGRKPFAFARQQYYLYARLHGGFREAPLNIPEYHGTDGVPFLGPV
jgi:hypothetical protein